MISPLVVQPEPSAQRRSQLRNIGPLRKATGTSRRSGAATENSQRSNSIQQPASSESKPAATFADASDLDAFTSGTKNNVSNHSPSGSADHTETISTEEASLLLDQFLSPTAPQKRQSTAASIELESATCNGLDGDTNEELRRIKPTARVGAPEARATATTYENSDVVPIDTQLPVAPPMMIPVPVPMPMPMPQWIPAPVPAESSSQIKEFPVRNPEQGAAEKVRLPPPETVAQPSTVTLDPEKTPEEQTSVASTAVDTDRQQERAQALRRLNRCIQQAKEDLQPLQEPLAGKAPRALSKNIKKLDSIDSVKFDDVVGQLNLIAKSKSLFALQTLKDYTDSRQGRYRQAATEGLAGIRAPGAAIALLDLLQDNTTAVSIAAVTGLVRMAFVETVPVLVALGRVDGRSRALMRDELSVLDAEVRERLVAPLKNAVKSKGDPAASAFAVSLLSQIKGGELLKMYMSLTRHPTAALRVAALEALVQTEEKQSVRFLNAGLADPAPSVRAAAAMGMAKISSPKSESLLIAALRDEQASVRRVAAQTLVEFESKTVGSAASKALNLETDPGVVEFLLEIVGRGGTDDALITLQKYLSSDDRELQNRAMATLRRLRNPNAAKLVAPLLSSEHHETRRLAVETVGLLKNKCVLPELREILKSDAEDQIRAAAARALGELKDNEAVCLLEESLHDSRAVRCQAVIALGNLGQKESAPALVAQLRDPAAEIRYHACHALGQIGDLPDPEPLQNLLEDKEAMVRRGAEVALTKMGHKVGQAKFARRLSKMTASMMPSVVAGALPGGTAMIAAVVLLVAVGIGYKTMGTVGAASETAFPVSDVHAIAVNHDGSQISVARKFNVLEVWDTSPGKLIAQFQTDAGAAGIVYRKDGNALILAGSKSFEMDVARVASDGKQALATAKLDNLSTHRVATTPDGTKTLLCTAAGKATLIDMAAQTKLLSFQVKDFGDRDAVAISPDATLAFVGTAGGHLKVFSLEDAKPLGRLDISQRIGSPGAGITALAMDAAGTVIAVGTSSGSVVVVGIDKMEVVGSPYSGTGSIISLAFQGNSKTLTAVTSRRELVSCADDFTSSKKLTTSLSELPQKVAFSANGHVAAFFYSESDQFCVVDLANDKMLTAYPNRS